MKSYAEYLEDRARVAEEKNKILEEENKRLEDKTHMMRWIQNNIEPIRNGKFQFVVRMQSNCQWNVCYLYNGEEDGGMMHDDMSFISGEFEVAVMGFLNYYYPDKEKEFASKFIR